MTELKDTKEIRIVFTAEPGEGGEFVEVENQDGVSIRAGEWFDRNDGFHELRIPVTPPLGYALVKMEGAEERVAHIIEAGIDLQSGHQAIAREIIRAMMEEK